MGLSLEMRKASSTKKLESLKLARGRAVVDEDNGKFVVLSKQIAAVENNIASIDQARAEADEESRRRLAADQPRRAAEARACRLAEVEGLETERLAAIAEAEKAARVLLAALQRAQAAAGKLNSTCPDTLVREPNFSIRMSERVASMLLPLAGGGDFWGYLSLAPAQHAHLAPDHDWVRGEREQFAGYIEMLRRPGR